MIGTARFLAKAPLTASALAAFTATQPAKGAALLALLSGQRPKRIASPDMLLSWVAEATGTPGPLLAACLAVTKDKAEVAALLLPPASGAAPSLTEVLATLKDRDSFLSLASRLPPEARLLLTRLAAGTLRAKLPEDQPSIALPGTILALLTLIDPAGPEATFALRQGNGLVPLTRLPLTLPETPRLLAWARANTTERFGPLRQVTPSQVFEIAYEGTRPNPRRKCGLDLVGAALVRWLPDATPDRAGTLSDLTARMPE